MDPTKLNLLIAAIIALPEAINRVAAALESDNNDPGEGTPDLPGIETPAAKGGKRGRKAGDATPAAAAPTVTLADLAPRVTKMVQEHAKGEAIVALAVKHGGTKVSTIPAANLAAFEADFSALEKATLAAAAANDVM